MIDEARHLYAAAPGDFIAGRSRVAKELKAAGRADDAAAVAALRRPKVSEHGLNRVAHDDPDLIATLAAAIAAASAAQTAAIGGTAEGLREATAALRNATRPVVDAAVRALTDSGANGEGQRDEIVALIREFVAAGNTAQLVQGIVGSGPIEAGDDVFGGATVLSMADHRAAKAPATTSARPGSKSAAPAAQQAGSKAAAPGGKQAGKPATKAAPAKPAPTAEDRAAERAKRLRDEQVEQVERLTSKLRAAEAALAAVQQEVRTATAAANEATAAVAAATRVLTRAERELTTKRDHLDVAQGRVASARTAVRDASTTGS